MWGQENRERKGERDEGRESGLRNANFAWQDSFRRKVRSFSRSLLSHASLTWEDEGSHPISHPLYGLQHTIQRWREDDLRANRRDKGEKSRRGIIVRGTMIIMEGDKRKEEEIIVVANVSSLERETRCCKVPSIFAQRLPVLRDSKVFQTLTTEGSKDLQRRRRYLKNKDTRALSSSCRN